MVQRISVTTEDDEQAAVITYCELLHLPVLHIPNEGKRSYQYGAKMKRLGLQKGFPDLFFPQAKRGYHGLMIEMKRDRRAKATIEQISWLSYLEQAGYCAKICHGFDEAKKVIDFYFGKTEKEKEIKQNE